MSNKSSSRVLFNPVMDIADKINRRAQPGIVHDVDGADQALQMPAVFGSKEGTTAIHDLRFNQQLIGKYMNDGGQLVNGKSVSSTIFGLKDYDPELYKKAEKEIENNLIAQQFDKYLTETYNKANPVVQNHFQKVAPIYFQRRREVLFDKCEAQIYETTRSIRPPENLFDLVYLFLKVVLKVRPVLGNWYSPIENKQQEQLNNNAKNNGRFEGNSTEILLYNMFNIPAYDTDTPLFTLAKSMTSYLTEQYRSKDKTILETGNGNVQRPNFDDIFDH